MREKIEIVLKTLSQRERDTLKLYYGLGDGYCYDFPQIESILKISPEPIRKTKTKAMQKLRRPVRKRMLEEFMPSYEANLIVDYQNLLYKHYDVNAPEVLAFVTEHKDNKMLMIRIKASNKSFRINRIGDLLDRL